MAAPRTRKTHIARGPGRACRNRRHRTLRRIRGTHPRPAVRRNPRPGGGLPRKNAFRGGNLRQEGAAAVHHRPQALRSPGKQGEGTAEQRQGSGTQGRPRPETHPPALRAERREPAGPRQRHRLLRKRHGLRGDERGRPHAGRNRLELHDRQFAAVGLYFRAQRRHRHARRSQRQIAAGDGGQERHRARGLQHDGTRLPQKQGPQRQPGPEGLHPQVGPLHHHHAGRQHPVSAARTGRLRRSAGRPRNGNLLRARRNGQPRPHPAAGTVHEGAPAARRARRRHGRADQVGRHREGRRLHLRHTARQHRRTPSDRTRARGQQPGDRRTRRRSRREDRRGGFPQTDPRRQGRPRAGPRKKQCNRDGGV